ncbi:hypothetical protein J19TS2_37710 [Cohnella xylanilytica]|nr:hypothetical protein J19TS2_37710 [Cohnella xylanilytica]
MIMSGKAGELPIAFFAGQAEMEQWMEAHHGSSAGIRLRIAKKNSGQASVTYDEALEVALCYGWIDSRKEAYDDESWIQRFTPRGPKSIWSKVNREKAERLVAEGRMKPAGYAAIEAAKRGGLWDKAYESQGAASMPEDLAAELESRPAAKAFFESLNSRNQYAFKFRLHQAKDAAARERKLRQFVEMLEKGECFYPQGAK